MNWDRMAGNWPESKNTVRKRWSKLTDDDLRRINGKRDQLVSVLIERYALPKDQIELQIKEFERSAEAEFGTAPSVKASGKSGQSVQSGQRQGDWKRSTAEEEEEEGSHHRSGA
jgi:uncharacterized protein YjbJ (UPF0337 family)